MDANGNVKEVILRNALENLKLTSPNIQKDLVNVSIIKTANAIITNLEDSLFAIFNWWILWYIYQRANGYCTMLYG